MSTVPPLIEETSGLMKTVGNIGKIASPVSMGVGIIGDIFGMYNAYQGLKEQKRVNRRNEEREDAWMAEEKKRYGTDLDMRQRSQRYEEGMGERTMAMHEQTAKERSAIAKENLIDQRLSRRDRDIKNKISMAAQMTAALMSQASTPGQRAQMAGIWR